MADQLAGTLGQAAGLTHQTSHRIDPVEHVLAGLVEVDLVSRHQRTQAQRVVCDEVHDPPVVLTRRVQREVDAASCTSPSPSSAAQRGKTTRIDDLAVVTPMK